MIRLRVRRAAVVSSAVAVLVALSGGAASAQSAEVGSLVIRAVTNPVEATAAFSFAVSCTGEAGVIERTVTVGASGGQGTAAVDGIPSDMACLVTDKSAPGWRVDSVNPQVAISSAAGTPVEFVHSEPAPASVSIVKTSEPDGAYAAGATPPSVPRGSAITYVLTFQNEGGSDTEAVITDVIAPGTTYADSPAPMCSPACLGAPAVARGRIRFTVPIEADTTGRVSYTVRVAADAADGDVLESGPASAQPGDGRSGSVLHRVGAGNVGTPRTGGLRLTETVDKDSAEQGEVVTYSIKAANAGTIRQQATVVTDVVPPTVEYVAGSATCAAPCRASYNPATRTVSWKLGALAPGAPAADLEFRARIAELKVGPNGSLPGTVALNSAVGSSETTPATRSNEVATIVVAVLGNKIVRRPAPVKITRPAAAKTQPTLPVTGGRTSSQLLAAFSMIAVGTGLLAGERRWNRA